MAIAQRPAAKVATKSAAPAAKAAAPVAAATKSTGANGVTLKEAVIKVSTTLLESGTIKGEPVEATEVEVKQFVTATANVGISAKFTKNLGNYESVQVSASVNMPCYNEEIDNAAAQVTDKVRQVLEQAMADLNLESLKSETVGGDDLTGTGEGTAEAGEEAAAEEGSELNEEWVRNASREELEALITENSVEIDPADYPEDDDLKEIIIATVFSEEGEAATEEAAAEEQAPYTEEELLASPMEDLQEVYKAWELGKFPAYTAKNEAVVKKTVVKKIMKYQEEVAAAA